jgi:hypothetical protein
VPIFLGERKVDSLNPRDPLLYRMPTFRQYYDDMASTMFQLLGRPLPRSAVTYASAAE